MAAGVILGVLFWVIIIGVLIWAANLKSKKKKAYLNALQELKQNPNDPNLHEKVLKLGRRCFGLKVHPEGKTQFGEVALMNDINAACAGRTVKVEVTNPHAFSGKSVAQEIEELRQLCTEGVLTDEEFERGKTSFLGAPPDKAAAAVKLLQHLDELRKQGVLSDSEFRLKKWDILSRK